MDDDVLGTNIRKFLKKAGITSHKEIEHAIQKALSEGNIDKNHVCRVSVRLETDLSDKPLIIDGEIRLS